MAGIGVINNPRSRQNRRNPDRIKSMGYILGERGESVVTHDLETLEDVAREFKQRDIDVLAINGGDGSNHVTLTTFINVYGDYPLPKIAFMRGGTYNTISDAMGIKGTPESIMFNLVEKYHNGVPFQTMEADIMKIGDHYGFIFGNGIVGNFMDDYYAGEEPPTIITGAKTLFSGISSALTGGPVHKRWFRKLHGSVVVDGTPLPRDDFSSIICMSVPNLGLGFKPAYRAFEKPHTMHCIAIIGSALGVVRDLPYLRMGRPWHPETAFDLLATRVEINVNEPFTYTVDGDMHRCEDGSLTLTMGPRLTVVQK